MKCREPKCKLPGSPSSAALVPARLEGLCGEHVAGFWVSPEGKQALEAVRDAARSYVRRLMGVRRAG